MHPDQKMFCAKGLVAETRRMVEKYTGQGIFKNDCIKAQ